MIGSYATLQAEYRPYPGRRHAGNPFVEALPLDLKGIAAIQQSLRSIPPEPGAADRKLPDHIRIDEVNGLRDCIFARVEYMRMAPMLLSNLKEAYYGRNPHSTLDAQRRHLIARLEQLPEDGRLPCDWKSHAVGMSLFGISGGGKTTFIDRLLLPLQVVIEHREYNGKTLAARQVVALKLSIPHDGTVKSLLMQFFERVDFALGTDYARQARGVGGIAEMVLLVVKVVTTISLGLLVIDELQNLRAARGPQVDHVLNLFVHLLELAGVSVLFIGTPAVQQIMEPSLRNIRKLTAGFECHLDAMPWGSPELLAFMEELWPQQWTRKVSRLTKDLRRAWYEAGAGSPAFMVASFMFAQRLEIGMRESIDDTSFLRASQRYMYSVQPAIKALISGRLEDLANFDDLLFSEPGGQLRGALNWQLGPLRTAREDEPDFPEFEQSPEPPDTTARQGRKMKKSEAAAAASALTEATQATQAAKAPKAAKAPRADLPVEDPTLLLR